MTYPAQHSSPRPFAYDAHGALGAGDSYIDEELMAGERIGPPIRRRRGKFWLAASLLIAFGGAWAVLGSPDTWPVRTWSEWAAGQVAAVSAALERKAPPPVERATSALAPVPANVEPAKLSPLEESAPAAPPAKAVFAPYTSDKSAPTPLTKGSHPPAADKPALEPLPPVHVDRADPLQVRAEAVGLHPGLSRVLLARLSDADYRNAGIAIKTAVAETPDSAVHVWPRQRTPELAVFKVHFVPGAASVCRRYVVTVTKDGWMTTALPMERCGAQARQALRK
jgi:hypothetical protein